MTENKHHVYSLICFLYKKKQYMGVSGDGDFFEIFDVSKFKKNEFLSKYFASFWFTKSHTFSEVKSFTKRPLFKKILNLFFVEYFFYISWPLESIKQVKSKD